MSSRKTPARRVRLPDSGIVVPLAVASVVFIVTVLVSGLPAAIRDAYSYEMTALRLVQDGYYSFSAALPGTAGYPNAGTSPGVIMLLAALFLPNVDGTTPAYLAVQRIQPWLVSVQLLMGVGIVLAVTLCGRLLGGRRLGLVAGLAASLYLPFAWAATVSLAEQLGTLLFSWLVWFGLRLAATDTRRSVAGLAGFGALAGATFLTRPGLALWFPVPLLLIAARRLEGLRRLSILGLAALLGFGVVSAPWWARNYSLYDRLVLVRSYKDGPAMVTPEPHDAGPSKAGPLPAYADKPMRNAAVRQAASTESGIAKVRESILNPWVPHLAVIVDDGVSPDKERRFAFPQPATYSPRALVALEAFARTYHLLILVAALASLQFVRRSPRIALLAAAPVASLMAHLLKDGFMNIRYLYPTMPALIVMAACGVVGITQMRIKRKPS